MYDAVWLYALALEKLVQEDETYLQNLHSNRSSDALVKIIKEIDFNGVSGRINFPGRSSRLSDIDIIQWCREGDTLSGDKVGVYKPDYTRYIVHTVYCTSSDVPGQISAETNSSYEASCLFTKPNGKCSGPSLILVLTPDVNPNISSNPSC